jgi:hypothetical protein
MNTKDEILKKINEKTIDNKINWLFITKTNDIYGEQYLFTAFKKIDGYKYMVIDVYMYLNKKNNNVHIYIQDMKTENTNMINIIYYNEILSDLCANILEQLYEKDKNKILLVYNNLAKLFY